MVYLQRSRGYSLRPSLFVEEIERTAKLVKSQAPDCIVMVDNCYGEFVEKTEPTSRGADLMAGSLIKNPGAASRLPVVISPGGRIWWSSALTADHAWNRPGDRSYIGTESRTFYGCVSCAACHRRGAENCGVCRRLIRAFRLRGYAPVSDPRADIIQVMKLGNEKSLVAFCQGIQKERQ